MKPEYFAKSNPPYTLRRHSYDVASKTKEFILQYPEDRLSEYGAKTENIEELAWIAGFYHDLGKANPNWQKWVHSKIRDRTNDKYFKGQNVYHKLQESDDNVRKPKHSAISAVITVSILQKNKFSHLCKIEKDAIFLAILHHHTDWTSDNMVYKKEINGKAKDIQKTVDNIPDEFYDKPIHNVKQMMRKARSVRNQADSREGKEWNKTRKTALLLYAGLRQSDWKESGRIKGDSPSFPTPFKSDDIVEFDSMREFQEKIKANSENECLLGLAGCGEGKTYSALLWGQKQVEIDNLNRLIFAMPTQVTTNNLYLNMESNTVPENKISLYHGSTQYIDYLYSDGSNIPDVEKAELYQAPINVTTVDHLVDTFVSNYSESPISFVNLLSSGIVFDEIQAYDDYTTQNILSCIKQCRHIGIPVYVMSATIPEMIRKEIPTKETVISEGKIKNKSRKPYKIDVKRQKLKTEDVQRNIKDSYDKIMVVKNTVREAQNIAKELMDDGLDVFYYSSEFSQSDRRKKEKEIKDEFGVGERSNEKTKILVCTQICEISLDLSADLLLTDIAPIDSIFQRCGRLHRSGTNVQSSNCNCEDCKNNDRKYKAIVYDSTNCSDAIYPYATDSDSKEFELLVDSADELSEFGDYKFDESIRVTDNVYEEYKTSYDYNIYDMASMSGSRYFINRSDRFNVRDIKTHRTNVLPGDSYPELQDEKSINDESIKIEVSPSEMLKYYKLNSVPIQSYWIHSSDIEMHRKNLSSGNITIPLYSNLKYDYNIGVQPPKEIEEP